MTDFKNRALELFSGAKPGSQFLSIRGYVSESSGEVADFSVVFGASYSNALKRSEGILVDLDLSTVTGEGFSHDDVVAAHGELLASVRKSLEKPGENPGYTKAGYYEPVCDGVKFSPENGKLYVYGMRVHKRVIVEGTYKKVKSAPKTLAKNALRNLLPINRFREFILDESHMGGLALGGLTESV